MSVTNLPANSLMDDVQTLQYNSVERFKWVVGWLEKHQELAE